MSRQDFAFVSLPRHPPYFSKPFANLLGGIDEFGKNITVFEYDKDIIVVDCGSMFPKDDMLGIDLVIPDASYLVANKDRVRGYVFTHGHEDHIGATPYILKQAPADVYGTKLTLALVDLKLKEYRVENIPMHVVQPRDTVQLGQFSYPMYWNIFIR